MAKVEEYTKLFGKPILYDLGAAGGTPPPFVFLEEELPIVTFEPEPNAEVTGNAINCPLAVGPQNLKTLYVNRRPTTSSLLRANKPYVDRYDFIRQFPGQGDIFETLKEIEIETSPLDIIVNNRSLPRPDFLKIDTQGLTYEVIEGAKETIGSSVLGMQIEVEFSECYKGQKTFGAIHELLYSMGFEIFDVSNINRWYFRTDNEIARPKGQHTFCDLTYFRKLEEVGGDIVSYEAMLKKLIGLLLMFDFNDAAMAYLERGVKQNIISQTDECAKFITDWPTSLEYFYDPEAAVCLPKSSTKDKLLDLSLRKLLNRIKKTISA